MISIPVAGRSVDIHQLVRNTIENLVGGNQCGRCGASDEDIDMLTGPGPGQWGGEFLLVELDRTQASFLAGGQAVSHVPITLAPTQNTNPGEAVFIISRSPGHWICYSRHRISGAWYKLDDMRTPTLADPIAEQGQNLDIFFVLFRCG